MIPQLVETLSCKNVQPDNLMGFHMELSRNGCEATAGLANSGCNGCEATVRQAKETDKEVCR